MSRFMSPRPPFRRARFVYHLLLLAALPGFHASAAEIQGGGGQEGKLKGGDRLPQPKLAAASNEWQAAMKRFQVAPNFSVDLFAAEPMLGNPVAFDIDHQGRFFVAETYRYRTSTLDIRHYMFMLEDDLAARSTDDRIAFTKKNFPKDWQKLEIETEVVRLVEDRNRDGKADFTSEYAAGMNTMLDGINSGVLARNGEVWCTNMPNLWRFSGTTAEGKAEKRESLSFGYGVRFSFTGHDMHGLAFGPDGRLYFSFGDRGASVKTKEGATLSFPDEGAVFRCEPDGSHMEVVAHGLRNPQELAFDKYGNLFTGDNDSDQGDRERWVYLVEGSDSGWRVGWQHHPIGKDNNPWLAEKMWEPRNAAQPAYMIPPIANIPDGPSGLAYYPGTGLPAKYDGHFFLCGFKGSAARSAVSNWSVTPKGAGFEMSKQETFIGDVQATDIAFGPDSKIYFTEWGEGWEGTGRGRIFKMWDAEAQKDPRVAEVQKLLAEGFAGKTVEQLSALLSNADQRVRLEAQWALATKADGAKALLAAAKTAQDQLARLHGIWGVTHAARLAEYKQAGAAVRMVEQLASLLADKDNEVRAQAAKAMGEGKVASAAATLVSLLKDPAERVRFFAAQSLGKLRVKDAAAPLVAMLRENAGKDLYLRHAGVTALAALADPAFLQTMAKDEAAEIRLASLLAFRRLGRAEVAAFLNDKEPALVLEAARAINDAPIADAMPQLAALAAAPQASEPLMFRVINANYRVGTPATAQALATLASVATAPGDVRIEALKQLGAWAKPAARDRMTGVYRPLAARPADGAVAAIRTALPALLADKSADLQIAALDAVGKLGIKTEGATLAKFVQTPSAPAKARLKALIVLDTLGAPELPALLKTAVTDKEASIRIEALTLLAKLNPDEAGPQLMSVFTQSAPAERKVIVSALADLKSAAADTALVQMVAGIKAGTTPPEVQLEVLDAAAKRKAPAVKKALDEYKAAATPGSPSASSPLLVGGDRAAGEKLFKEHAVAQCFRCHKVQGAGGDAGPDLTKIAASKDRAYLLESILDPNAKIAEGFQMLVVTKKNGEILAGNVKSESATEVVLQPPGVPAITVAKNEIASQTPAPSGMPPGMGDLLTKREIRDIMEYVATLK